MTSPLVLLGALQQASTHVVSTQVASFEQHRWLDHVHCDPHEHPSPEPRVHPTTRATTRAQSVKKSRSEHPR